MSELNTHFLRLIRYSLRIIIHYEIQRHIRKIIQLIFEYTQIHQSCGIETGSWLLCMKSTSASLNLNRILNILRKFTIDEIQTNDNVELYNILAHLTFLCFQQMGRAMSMGKYSFPSLSHTYS